jgi:hypothetical protein
VICKQFVSRKLAWTLKWLGVRRSKVILILRSNYFVIFLEIRPMPLKFIFCCIVRWKHLQLLLNRTKLNHSELNFQLGNGTAGTDVRVRNNKLHCQNCYSNDEGNFKLSKLLLKWWRKITLQDFFVKAATQTIKIILNDFNSSFKKLFFVKTVTQLSVVVSSRLLVLLIASWAVLRSLQMKNKKNLEFCILI